MRVDLVIRKLLTATAEKTGAERRIALLRDQLDREARRRYSEEGAAPTWKAPRLGVVRLDPKDAKPYVDDAQAFANYVAERHPDEVEATITLPAASLEAAIDALDFAGVGDYRALLEVREPFRTKLLEELKVETTAAVDPSPSGDSPVEVAYSALRLLDETTGEVEAVAGVKVHPPGATLVVTLDRDAKARAIADADAAFEVEQADDRVDTDDNTIGASALAGPGVADGSTLAADLAAADYREPYVDDPDPVTAALRSADVDREELDTLPTGPHQPGYDAAAGRRVRLEESIRRWEAQAARLRDAQVAEREPAPELSAAERAIVDRFDAAPDALEQDAADALAEASAAYDHGTPEQPSGVVDGLAFPDEPNRVTAGHAAELDALFRTDDLKRVARRRRLPVSGTKAALALRLARAGVTATEAREVAEARP